MAWGKRLVYSAIIAGSLLSSNPVFSEELEELAYAKIPKQHIEQKRKPCSDVPAEAIIEATPACILEGLKDYTKGDPLIIGASGCLKDILEEYGEGIEEKCVFVTGETLNMLFTSSYMTSGRRIENGTEILYTPVPLKDAYFLELRFKGKTLNIEGVYSKPFEDLARMKIPAEFSMSLEIQDLGCSKYNIRLAQKCERLYGWGDSALNKICETDNPQLELKYLARKATDFDLEGTLLDRGILEKEKKMNRLKVHGLIDASIKKGILKAE